jgi:hypothetical protein
LCRRQDVQGVDSGMPRAGLHTPVPKELAAMLQRHNRGFREAGRHIRIRVMSDYC